MKSLQQLDVFTSVVIHDHHFSNNVEGLLKATAANVKKLILWLEGDRVTSMMSVVSSIEEWAKQGNPLPMTINILMWVGLFVCLLASSSNLPSSFEICLFDINKVPMNLYPPMPFGKFAFGHSLTPPFIQLGNYGITGLKFDMFYLSKYDDHGTIKHTITRSYTDIYKPPEIARNHLNPCVIYNLSPMLISLNQIFILITWNNLLFHVLIFSDLIWREMINVLKIWKGYVPLFTHVKALKV